MAKKNRWSPTSAVNQNHVCGMLAKGNADYKAWVAQIFAATPAELEELVYSGLDNEYLNEDNMETLLGGNTRGAKEVAEAAAADATLAMIASLLAAKQDGALKALIKGGSVTQAQVDLVKAG